MATPQQAHLYHATNTQSPAITRYETPRVRPSQAPSLRVTPRVIPIHVVPPRVDHIVAPHPVSPNSPYVPQGMPGENLFNTFEEEHMETPSPQRYNTRARYQQHSAHSTQQNAPRIFGSITFTATSGFHVDPQQAYKQIPMVNDVINQDTGTSFE
jgi:hypothetical protein